ncbi:hypothetical protein TcYC6_0074520 [Trypanosoma cruzi]|nr:hypothetical protein TcYC6_0074520 [Trypanosoma cruzi]
MKFWVKAITDDSFQEQLLVKASNLPELTKELSRLLNTHVTWMSVSDFQTQVVEKLKSGVEILPVKILTSKMAGQPHDGETSFVCSEPYTQHATPAQVDISQTSSKEDEAWPFSSRSPSLSEAGVVARPSSASWALLDIPQVDRICLFRKDIELLLHPSFGGTYVDIVAGCFVRIRERQDYGLYQIIRLINNMELLLDIIHYEETRSIGVVSNAPPVPQEVSTWGKKMVSAHRSFMAPGFIEDKLGDIDSAMRAARATLQDQYFQMGITPPLTPPAHARDSSGQHRRRTLLARTRMYPFISLGQLVLETNDVLLHAQVSVIEEPETDASDLVLFATRHTNSGKEKTRPSDFAGCMLTINKSGEPPVIVSDRDVTVKGYEVFCPPQKWDCQYVTLGQIQPSVDSILYFDDDKKYTQEFTVLSGNLFGGLFNSPTTTMLPIPVWAKTEGVSAHIIRPHLVLHREKLHVFYIVRMLGPHPPHRSSLFRVKGCGGLGAQVSGEESSIANVASDEKKAVDTSPTSVGNASCDGSFCENAMVGVCRYSLAHAVCLDPELHSWKLVTEKGPLFSCFYSMPIFTVASTFYAKQDSDEACSTPLKNKQKVLQILWYEEDFILRQPSALTYRPSRLSLPSSSTISNRASLPFERLVNSHEEVLPEHWVQEPCYSPLRVDVESLRVAVASLSLFESYSTTFAACLQRDDKQRSVLTVLPLTNEP